MNKVYIVIKHIFFEDSDILAVFSTREKAKRYIKKEYPNYKYDKEFDNWIDFDEEDEIYIQLEPVK